ncbi:MAG: DUF2726 domain-containing protein [Pseudomonadota bacterium]
MIQDAYHAFIAEAGFLFLVFTAGFLIAMFMMLEAIRKAKARRAIAEFRRQRRHHEAAIAREREAHAAEIAILRERLRAQDDAPKSFDAITAVGIERQRLMNRSEYWLYKTLQALAPDLPGHPLIFPQVPIGEVLRVVPSKGTPAERRRASQDIQCKRVDFALTDRSGHILAAVEYQGRGHYQGTAAFRDQIKQAVFRRAGIPLVEIEPHASPDDIAAILAHALSPKRAPGRPASDPPALASNPKPMAHPRSA